MTSTVGDLLHAAPGLTRAQLCARVSASPSEVDRTLELPPGTYARVLAGHAIPPSEDVRLAAWLQRFVVELDPEPVWVWAFGVPPNERRDRADDGMRLFVRCRCGNGFLAGSVAPIAVKRTRASVYTTPWTLPEGHYALGVVWYHGRGQACTACGKGGPWRPQAVILCDDRLRLEPPQ